MRIKQLNAHKTAMKDIKSFRFCYGVLVAKTFPDLRKNAPLVNFCHITGLIIGNLYYSAKRLTVAT